MWIIQTCIEPVYNMHHMQLLINPVTFKIDKKRIALNFEHHHL